MFSDSCSEFTDYSLVHLTETVSGWRSHSSARALNNFTPVGIQALLLPSRLLGNVDATTCTRVSKKHKTLTIGFTGDV